MKVSKELPPGGEALAGALGAVAALVVVYPLDIIKTRLQVNRQTIGRVARDIIHKDGLLGLYYGMPAALLGVFSTNYAYFYWYSLLRSNYQQLVAEQISIGWELLVGAVAGAFAQCTTIPVSVVVTRQQTVGEGFWATGRRIVYDDGIRGLWRGLGPSLVLVVNPAITYAILQRMLAHFQRSGRDLLQSELFIAAVVAKAVATIITYPYIMAKVRMQYKERQTASAILRKMRRNEGLRSWYRGLGAQILKAVLSQALLVLVKDRISRSLLLLLRLLQRNFRVYS